LKMLMSKIKSSKKWNDERRLWWWRSEKWKIENWKCWLCNFNFCFSLNKTIGLNSGIDYSIKMKFDWPQCSLTFEVWSEHPSITNPKVANCSPSSIATTTVRITGQNALQMYIVCREILVNWPEMVCMRMS